MDRLSRESTMAIKAGMSYGKWKAMQQHVEIKAEPGMPAGMIRCPWCNTPFRPKPNQQYCNLFCQKEAQRKREKEAQAEKEVAK